MKSYTLRKGYWIQLWLLKFIYYVLSSKCVSMWMLSDWLSVLCRRGPDPPEVCWAALVEGLHKSRADTCPLPDQRLESQALPPRARLLLWPFFFPPWASRSPPVISEWSGGTHRCLVEGEWSPSSHCEGIWPHLVFLRRCWREDIEQINVLYFEITSTKPNRQWQFLFGTTVAIGLEGKSLFDGTIENSPTLVWRDVPSVHTFILRGRKPKEPPCLHGNDCKFQFLWPITQVPHCPSFQPSSGWPTSLTLSVSPQVRKKCQDRSKMTSHTQDKC